MSIKKKLILFMLIAILLSSAVIITTNRMVTTREIQDITRNDLEDTVNTAYHLIRISPALDIKKLQTVFNKDLKIGRTGFLFVVNTKGELVVHKKAQGQNWKNKPHIKHIINARSGYLRYLSPKTNTYKVAVYRHYAPQDWIIVASNFEGDALDAPLANMAKLSIQMLVPAMIVLCLLFIFFLSRTVVKPITSAIAVLSNGAGHVASTSEHIASASQQLAKGATEQAAAIEETSASLEEMSSMTKQNADNAGQADGLMQKTTKIVGSANDSMGRLTSSMADISTASEETSKIINTVL